MLTAGSGSEKLAADVPWAFGHAVRQAPITDASEEASGGARAAPRAFGWHSRVKRLSTGTFHRILGQLAFQTEAPNEPTPFLGNSDRSVFVRQRLREARPPPHCAPCSLALFRISRTRQPHYQQASMLRAPAASSPLPFRKLTVCSHASSHTTVPYRGVEEQMRFRASTTVRARMAMVPPSIASAIAARILRWRHAITQSQASDAIVRGGSILPGVGVHNSLRTACFPYRSRSTSCLVPRI